MPYQVLIPVLPAYLVLPGLVPNTDSQYKVPGISGTGYLVPGEHTKRKPIIFTVQVQGTVRGTANSVKTLYQYLANMSQTIKHILVQTGTVGFPWFSTQYRQYKVQLTVTVESNNNNNYDESKDCDQSNNNNNKSGHAR